MRRDLRNKSQNHLIYPCLRTEEMYDIIDAKDSYIAVCLHEGIGFRVKKASGKGKEHQNLKGRI